MSDAPTLAHVQLAEDARTFLRSDPVRDLVAATLQPTPLIVRDWAKDDGLRATARRLEYRLMLATAEFLASVDSDVIGAPHWVHGWATIRAVEQEISALRAIIDHPEPE